jgi:hypothetical protein
MMMMMKYTHHNYVDLRTPTGASLPVGSSEIVLAAGYKFPGRACSDTDFIELLSFRDKPLLTCGLNDKNPVWNSQVSNPSGEKLVELFYKNDFKISALQCRTHCTPKGNGDRPRYCVQ